MKRLASLAVAIAALLCLAAPAGAALPQGNLLANPGGEDGPGGGADIPPGWRLALGSSPNATAVRYGAPGGFPDAALGQALGGGSNFFAGGPPNTNGQDDDSAAFRFADLQQSLDVSGAEEEIDAGTAVATIAGCLGGYGDQNDFVIVSAFFYGPFGNKIGQVSVDGPGRTERANQTALLPKAAQTNVPPLTRRILFDVQFIRNSGPGTYNDGYADNLLLALAAASAPAPGASCSVPAAGGGPSPGGGGGGAPGSPTTTPFAVTQGSSSARLSRSGSAVAVALTCAGPVTPCTGSVALSAASLPHASSVSLGARSFSIAPGATQAVQVKLGRSAKKRLARLSRRQLRRLRLTATVTMGGVSKSFRLKLGV